METVEASEARIHLAQLLERIAGGRRRTIAKHGAQTPILQAADPSKKMPVRDVIDRLKQFRSRRRLGELSIREMIEEGRR